MRTTQGQAAFGHNVQMVITYSNELKTFYNMYRWTRRFNVRLTHVFRGLTPTNKISVNYSFSGVFQATPVEFGSPHEPICAEFIDACLPIIHSY
jgi:hypothetical protein